MSVPPVRIPPRQVPTFRCLAAMSAEQFDHFVNALDGDLVLNPSDLDARLRPLWPADLPPLPEVLDAFLSLSASIQFHSWDLAATTNEIALQFSRSSEQGGDDLPAAEVSVFSDRLRRTLGSSSVAVTAKSIALARDVEHELHAARVITDLRPIFADDTEDPGDPVGMMVLTTLRLDYFDETGSSGLHITLTDSQVAELADHLKRAAAKADLLRGLVEKLDLSLHRRDPDYGDDG